MTDGRVRQLELPVGYQVGKQLRSAPANRVLTAVRAADGRQVILKVYSSTVADDASDRARRELETLRSVAGIGVPRALDLHLDLPAPVLVVEQCRGVSALEWAGGDLPGVGVALRVGIQLAGILERVHRARVLHRDIRPTNVLVEPNSLEAHLLDFGLARRLGVTSRGPREVSGAIEGSLHYLSPEQTGRMNRGCDARSDLYSLGATLYFIFTGHAPFEIDDPLELIHAHLARRPRSPCELRPTLPDALGGVILKMLEKEPDDRYQSAAGVRMDLEHVLAHLESGPHALAAFVPGAAECPERPRFPGRIFGRDRELADLRNAYARAVAGRCELVVLCGPSGAGKSTLVQQLREDVAKSHGSLVAGKFDQVRDRPYAGWQAALSSLLAQILVASDELLDRWKRELETSLGALAGAIQSLAPDLSFVLGEIPPLPPLGPAETRARLTLALERFLRAVATREHPLVVLLDDVQWCDAASLHLLEEMALRTADAALLLVATYRSDEVGPEHPLRTMYARLAARAIRPVQIELGPLDSSDTVAMLASALERSPASLGELAGLVERKTRNNPLLIREFLEALSASGVLRYEQGRGWVEDLEAVGAADVPEGAVALLTPKIEALQPCARELLTLASWVSDEFDAEMLAQLSQLSQEEIEARLFVLNDAGLITPCDLGFRFVHDRVREAARSRLGAAERVELHLAIARALLGRGHAATAADATFEIADHFEAGADGIEGELRSPAIQSLLGAGNKALASGAAHTAERYFATARRLFGASQWETAPHVGFELWLQSAEAAYQRHESEPCDRFLKVIEALDVGIVDRARVAAKRAQWLTFMHGQEACVHFTLARLRELGGVSLPIHPGRIRAQWALFWRDRTLRRLENAPGGPFRPPTQLHPRSLAALLLLNTSSAALSRVDVHLAVLGLTSAIGLQLRHGFLGSPAFTIAVHAVYVYIFLGRAARARQLAELAMRINARQPDPLRTGRTEIMIHGILNPFLMSRRVAVGRLSHSARLCEECGDLEFAFYARRMRALILALGGHKIAEMEREVASDLVSPALSGGLRQDMVEVSNAYSELALPEVDLARLESALLASEARAANAADGDVFPRTMWMMVLTIYGRFDRVLELADRVGDRLRITAPWVHVIDHCFYRAVAAAHAATGASGLRRRRLLRTLRQSRRWIVRVAREGPDFVHMRTFLDAERARLRGAHAVAVALYDRAAREAMKQQFLHHAALASERAAELLLASRRSTEAHGHLSRAIERYRHWGAIAKAHALERRLASL